MSKAKFAAVKELIEQKRYAEARALLKTIDHPLAREWLEKIDQRAPRRRWRRVLIPALAVGLIVIGLAVALLSVMQTGKTDGALAAFRTDFVTMCVETLATNTPGDEMPDFATNIESCNTMADGLIEYAPEQTLDCQARFPVNAGFNHFLSCIMAQNAMPAIGRKMEESLTATAVGTQ